MPGATAQVLHALFYLILATREAYGDERNMLEVWAFRKSPWGEDEEGKRINYRYPCLT